MMEKRLWFGNSRIQLKAIEYCCFSIVFYCFQWFAVYIIPEEILYRTDIIFIENLQFEINER